MQYGMLYKMTVIAFYKTLILVIMCKLRLTFFRRYDMLNMLGRLWQRPLFLFFYEVMVCFGRQKTVFLQFPVRKWNIYASEKANGY